MFFELREYRTLPGQRENWVRFMEEEIIPFQVSKGMVIVGSFVGEEEDDLYIWVRRFDSEEVSGGPVRGRVPERPLAQRHRPEGPRDARPRQDSRSPN